ncbi:MAG: hypothetical protein GY703_11655 [Gammaproteobacteria bacterium]|nr:hypothetical protein [Gammaproteobacteria bacterium]
MTLSAQAVYNTPSLVGGYLLGEFVVAGMDLTRKRQAYRVVSAQLVVTLIATVVLLFPGWVYALSGFAGGLIATAANAAFAIGVFVHFRAQEPGKLLGHFYRAELVKLVLTALLFAGVFICFDPLSPGALFGVYVLVQITPMLVAHVLT